MQTILLLLNISNIRVRITMRQLLVMIYGTHFFGHFTELRNLKMANHTKTITLTDVQQKILANDLYSDSDNAGLDEWIQQRWTAKSTTVGSVCNRSGQTS